MSSQTQKRPAYDQPGSLVNKTRCMLQEEAKATSLFKIASETGLPFYWLRKFAAGEIPGPSVNRIQFLYEKLSAKKIAV